MGVSQRARVHAGRRRLPSSITACGGGPEFAAGAGGTRGPHPATGCVLPGEHGRSYYPPQRARRSGVGAPPPPGRTRDAAIHTPRHQVMGGPRRHHHPGAELRRLRHQRRVHRREPLCGGDRGRRRCADDPVRPAVPARPAARAGALRPPRSDPGRGPPRRPYRAGAQPPRARVPAGCRGQQARPAGGRRERDAGARELAGLQQRAGAVRPRALRPGARAQQHDPGRVRGPDPRRHPPQPAPERRRRRAQGAGSADRGRPPLPRGGAQRRARAGLRPRHDRPGGAGRGRAQPNTTRRTRHPSWRPSGAPQ